MPIFVVTLEGKEPGDPTPLTVLAFIQAPDEAAAEQGALAALADRNWPEARFVRAGEVTDEAAVPPDFATALASANRHGLGLIIYENP
ncbi:hypothetical protein [Phenylobacterium sp. J367]|uniref:hypothetical protein n=1 Tax=Phenylobacterium sp. J367 TaxID=2898435 RepID=UPI002150E78A|nr:hypothetical protein [Phenylobacterium sp. J367]MCR5877840.1 hypothetical protein [Phenylobacterium sp. J367]